MLPGARCEEQNRLSFAFPASLDLSPLIGPSFMLWIIRSRGLIAVCTFVAEYADLAVGVAKGCSGLKVLLIGESSPYRYPVSDSELMSYPPCMSIVVYIKIVLLGGQDFQASGHSYGTSHWSGLPRVSRNVTNRSDVSSRPDYTKMGLRRTPDKPLYGWIGRALNNTEQ